MPRTGVVYVTREAARLGFDPADPAWVNLGQGAREAGTPAAAAATAAL